MIPHADQLIFTKTLLSSPCPGSLIFLPGPSSAKASLDLCNNLHQAFCRACGSDSDKTNANQHGFVRVNAPCRSLSNEGDVFAIQGFEISRLDFFPTRELLVSKILTLNLMLRSRMCLWAQYSHCCILHCSGCYTSLLHRLRCKQTALLLSFYFRNNKPNYPRMRIDC